MHVHTRAHAHMGYEVHGTAKEHTFTLVHILNLLTRTLSSTDAVSDEMGG
jgi:hypothetical protein